MRPEAGTVLHFSEDPTISCFVPHVVATAQRAGAHVWAVDEVTAPGYWFPRDCPRAMAWATPTTTPDDLERVLGPGGGERVHAIEYGWLDRIRTVDFVVTSTLGYSGIRLANAAPRIVAPTEPEGAR